jgi:hypothetical protein
MTVRIAAGREFGTCPAGQGITAQSGSYGHAGGGASGNILGRVRAANGGLDM